MSVADAVVALVNVCAIEVPPPAEPPVIAPASADTGAVHENVPPAGVDDKAMEVAVPEQIAAGDTGLTVGNGFTV